VAKWLKRMAPLVPGLNRGRRRGITAWMGDQVSAATRTVFPLVHHDVDKTNVLLGDDGRLRLLDFGRCGHWFPQYDLIVSEASLCWSHPERIEVLRNRYFAAPGVAAALSRDQYEVTRPLWAACYHLRCAASRARRVTRGNQEAADEARAQWAAVIQNLRAAGAPSSLLPEAAV
jgi:Ser/Thr protein kinase RdoA (MazF antagonist)